jgi:hypothetical protein
MALDMMNNSLRGPLRRVGKIVYVLVDFNISIQFPQSSTPAERRLPPEFSWCGPYARPADTDQGELDYDPFAFDVGCLGVLFWDNFKVRGSIMIDIPYSKLAFCRIFYPLYRCLHRS